MKITSRIRQLFEYSEFLKVSIKKELKLRYTESVFGMLWMILEPLFLVLTLTFVFAVIGRKAPGGAPFILYFYSGILPWQLFNSLFSSGARCFISDKAIIQKLPFPKEFCVIKKVVRALIDFGLMAIIYIAILIYYRVIPNIYFLWLPILFFLLTAFGASFMFLLGTINVFIRDISFLTSTASRLWFWFTPIIFIFPYEGHAKLLYYLNPLTGVITSIRGIILDGKAPELIFLVPILIATTLVFVSGYALFLKNERYFVDVL